MENICVEKVSKSFGGKKVFENLSLTISGGEMNCIMAPSGAGKTTLLRILMGLEETDSGWITGLEGKRFSAVFQEERLCEYMTAGDNIRLVTPGLDAGIVVQEMDRLGLGDCCAQPVSQLSGGMRQRVMIAMAVSCAPKLLIADEPTTALDVTIQAQILELMMELKDKLGMAIIMITHDLGVVANMCEKIAVMYAGRIVEYGTAEDIFYRPKHEYTKGLIRSIPRLDTKEHERLVPIEGTPVDMLNPPKGCPFAPRCDKCMKICLREMPPVTTFSDTHYTQCWLNQKAEMEGGAANE